MASAGCSPRRRCGARRRRRDGDRPHEPPPLPAAALPGGHRHPRRGRHRAADPRRPAPAAQRERACSARSSTSTSTHAGVTVDTLGRRSELPYDSLIVAAGAHAVVLRPPRVRARRARHEDDRRRARAARPDLRCLRARRAGARPGGAAPPADVRGDRRGPDRRRARRAARGALAARAARQLPAHRHGRGADRPARRRPDDPRRSSRRRCSSARCATSSGWASRSAPASPSRASTPTASTPAPTTRGSGASRRPRRSGPPASRPRRSGTCSPSAAGAETDRAGRVKVEPDCTLPGHPEVFVVGDLMSLDGLPGVAPGRDPVRPPRRGHDPPPPRAATPPRGPSATATSARWRRSHASVRSAASAPCGRRVPGLADLAPRAPLLR